MVLQFRELFYMVGIQTTMKRDFKPNNYKGVIAKIPTYNFWLKILNFEKFKDEIGFIQERKQKRIKDRSNHLYFAIKDIRKKIREKNNPNYKGELIREQLTKDYIDVPVRKIQKIEEIEYNDYVYDIETENTHKFFANGILVHNTDSVYIVDPFHNKQKMLEVKDKIINDIKATVPFPQNSFDMGVDDEIKYMFFFKGGNKDKDDAEFDTDDFINKNLGLMKKNYIYVTKDDRVVIKNLGIKKKSNTPLSRKIFWEHLVPKIKQGQIKFSKTYIKSLIHDLLEKDIKLMALRKDVGQIEQYKSQTSLEYQVALKYGSGIHFLIPNTRNIGVGKGKSYCTIEEFREKKLKIEDIDLSNVMKELDYFIKPPVVKDIFSFN